MGGGYLLQLRDPDSQWYYGMMLSKGLGEECPSWAEETGHTGPCLGTSVGQQDQGVEGVPFRVKDSELRVGPGREEGPCQADRACAACPVARRREAPPVRRVLAIFLAARLPAQAYGHAHGRARLPMRRLRQALHAEELAQRAHAHTPPGARALPRLRQGLLAPRTTGAPPGCAPCALIVAWAWPPHRVVRPYPCSQPHLLQDR